ncbi:MAG: RNA polymerase sigma factor [Phycisphaerales bacterium]|nr:RNA polymerase sigma factor [Phycisphaerales bacterium]MCB9855602.1 RNA polymerase sigma factor [Phycisphaerales bacterium]MCB9864909.1 RNA polymerase sigma factor [Phycisphaerales bacterium]
MIRIHEGDHELIAAAQRGERSALDAFVHRHDGWVRQIVYATTGRPGLVDDVAQSVWTGVWQQIATLSDPERWRGWLYRLAKNAAIDAGRRQARERGMTVGLNGADPATCESDPARRASQSEEQQRMLRAIRGLPDHYREPFILRHLQEWSYAEIGEAMGLPIDTVETRLVRARRLLREALGNSEGR